MDALTMLSNAVVVDAESGAEYEVVGFEVYGGRLALKIDMDSYAEDDDDDPERDNVPESGPESVESGKKIPESGPKLVNMANFR